MPKLTSNQILNRSGVVGNTVTDALETLRTTGSFGDMSKAVYDTNNNGKVDVAEVAENVQWVNIYDKPFTFPPSAHSHTDATIADSGFMSASDKTKLDGITPGATANDTDVNLKSRANHTGTQAISTVTGLQTALDGKQDTLVSGTNIKTINGDSLLGSGNLVISGGGGADPAVAIHNAAAKPAPADADELGYVDSAASWGLKKLTFANLKSWIGSFFVSKSGDTINGNLNFGGVGRRITGDFSNATLANRLLFQTSTPNGVTGISVLPNGTSTISDITVYNSQDPSNASAGSITQFASEMRLANGVTGSGAYCPMTFYTGGAERLRIDTSGNVSVQSGSLICGNGQTAAFPPAGITVNPTTHATSKRTSISIGSWIIGQDSLGNGAQDLFLYDSAKGLMRLRIDNSGNVLVINGTLGYGVGAGGTVVQATSKTTAVTLNKPSGQIQMHPDSLGAGASVIFTLANDKINYGSTLGVTLYDGGWASNYRVECAGVSAGTATIRLTNVSGTSRAEGVYVYFNVITGVGS